MTDARAVDGQMRAGTSEDLLIEGGEFQLLLVGVTAPGVVARRKFLRCEQFELFNVL